MELLLSLMDQLIYFIMNLKIVQTICVLDNFISVDISFSNAFLGIAFCYVANKNSWGKNYFYEKFWYSFLKLLLLGFQYCTHREHRTCLLSVCNTHLVNFITLLTIALKLKQLHHILRKTWTRFWRRIWLLFYLLCNLKCLLIVLKYWKRYVS